jgi:hypothetical protein
VTPEDVRAVHGSWQELQRCRAALLDALTRCFEAADVAPPAAPVRAGWLLAAVEDLVGLLPAPSSLAARARELGPTWPEPRTAPCFPVEGVAWLVAARECLPSWTPADAAAWRQAWLLLAEVLAVEALSPFADPSASPAPAPAAGSAPPRP